MGLAQAKSTARFLGNEQRVMQRQRQHFINGKLLNINNLQDLPNRNKHRKIDRCGGRVKWRRIPSAMPTSVKKEMETSVRLIISAWRMESAATFEKLYQGRDASPQASGWGEAC